MTEFKRITDNSEHLATIRDTDISVYAVMVEALAGKSVEQILEQFPTLETADIHEALSYVIQGQSIACINSLQELRPEIATISGYSDLFIVGLRSDKLTSRNIAQIILKNANMLNYKCMYQVMRARLLNPWFSFTDWGVTQLGSLQSQIGIYLTPNVKTVDFTVEFTDQTFAIDSRIVPITGFLTQGHTNAEIIVRQAETIQIEVKIPQLPAEYTPLGQVEHLAKVVLNLLDSQLEIINSSQTKRYRYAVKPIQSD